VIHIFLRKGACEVRCVVAVLGLVLTVTGGSAWGWWPGGHSILTRAAVQALPEDVPAFFRSGAGMVAHGSYDPDVSKNRGTPHLRAAEYAEHFLDLELLKGRELPDDRYAYVALCCELGVKPEKAGFLPYALCEWTERLAVAFAEHRKWPGNPFVQNKCLVYAGFISHYAQDMCQPLHLTIHYDGRIQPDGSKLGKGIHAKVDGIVEYLALDPNDLAGGQKVEPLADLMPGILGQLEAGYSLVDRVYELEAHLPSGEGKAQEPPVPAVVDFATERAREATRFTASLYLTAWRLSEKVSLPGWLDRARDDQGAF